MRRALRIVWHVAPALLAIVVYAVVVAPVSRISTALRRRRGQRPKIVRGPVPIISIHYASRADRLRGYRSDTVVYRRYRINDAGVFDLDLSRLTRIRLLGQLVPYAAFVVAGLRYDVFSFFFDGGLIGETPFWRAELPLLRLAGKRIVVYPYGSDARLPSRTRAIPGWNAYSDISPGAEDTDERDVRRRLDAFGRYANAILGCADLVEDLPRIDGVFQFPVDVARWQPVPPPADSTVRILHAPNHRRYKGTRFVEAAVAHLRDEGAPVELVLVEGRTGSEARRLYEQAHIVVDQLLIGAYAMFAIECMALGKPVVCYLNDRFRPYHPEWAECPIVSASPDTIVDELRRLVADPGLRSSLGASGPEYVRRVHSLEAVGETMDAVYRSVWGGAAA
ncbi:MAG: hypothetical protein ABI990_00660 [Actinomycetota bacterium]